MFKKVDPKQNFPKLEEDILKFWEDNKIFEKSLEINKDKKKFNFYDGPPFATGLPHYGHILAMAIKDAVVRYKTMQGYYVPRKFGWDCHGLPVENLIEKELGISGKPDIEKMGVEKFNNACRASVLKYTGEWRKTIRRIGRWGDLDNTYVTMDNNYIESIWWVFSQIYEKDLIYKGFKSMPYCPRCGTPLSNFETNLGYRENVSDPSIYIKFKILDKKNTYFLVWTTTPWTLPGNAALAVGKNIDYSEIKLDNGEMLILAKDRIADSIKENYKVIKNYKGKDLLNWRYEPLYKFISFKEKAHYVIDADFVSTGDGTGIVHIAPAFGEDDLESGLKLSLPILQTVDKNGKMIPEVIPWQGMFVKTADPKIIDELKERNLLYRSETIKHTYPFCWRCDSPLIYYAIDSWFIKVSAIRDKLVKNNKKIHWMPEHIKNGRFGKWLAEARDWAVSRSRYWGAPVPIWQCNNKVKSAKLKVQSFCHNIKVINSVAELEKLSGKKVSDLHRPYIDNIEVKCDKCGGKMKRTSEVLDCWFESGSMPYAQYHYPYEMKESEFLNNFPADFIAEGLDQTRGWFYTLHVIAAILFDKPAFYNCIVNGIIVASDGKKLSKRLKNYPEPSEIFNKEGVDGLRWFLLSSSAAVAEDVRFSSQHVADTVRRVILIFWNIYSFFTTYSQLDGFKPDRKNSDSSNILDKWIINYLNQTIKTTTENLDTYDLPKALRSMENFITDLSVWYLRRSRKRQDKNNFYQTLYDVIMTLIKLLAPFMPFISEAIYQNLKGKNDPESVHLCQWPELDTRRQTIDDSLLKSMKNAREIVEYAHALRAEAKIKVRQPLLELRIKKPGLSQDLLQIIAEEINVKKAIIDKNIKESLYLETKITPELKEEGLVREIIRQIQSARKRASLNPQDRISIYLDFYNNIEYEKAFNKYKNQIISQIIVEKILTTLPSKPYFEVKTRDFYISIVK
ncbi:MAG: isoleucine--tRNA ligase [Patescibacteria group bacterium]|nr:isoleucine--tRNA ligase [Patescibacteria group bacterium]